MTESIQPDLFGDYDRTQAQAERWRQPATCPACGTEVHNAWELDLGHGFRPGEPGVYGYPLGKHPIYGADCLTQFNVRNHIIAAVRGNDPDRLTERMQRGRELRLDVETIAAAAREESPKKSSDLLDSIDQLD